MSGDEVVDIEDDEITEEGNEETDEQIWRSFLVSLNASYPLNTESEARPVLPKAPLVPAKALKPRLVLIFWLRHSFTWHTIQLLLHHIQS